MVFVWHLHGPHACYPLLRLRGSETWPLRLNVPEAQAQFHSEQRKSFSMHLLYLWWLGQAGGQYGKHWGRVWAAPLQQGQVIMHERGADVRIVVCEQRLCIIHATGTGTSAWEGCWCKNSCMWTETVHNSCALWDLRKLSRVYLTYFGINKPSSICKSQLFESLSIGFPWGWDSSILKLCLYSVHMVFIRHVPLMRVVYSDLI